MKSPHDPRHKKRQHIVEELFSSDFHPQRVSTDTKEVLEQLVFIDEKIKEVAPEFPVNKINKVDLAILRLALFELLIKKDTPPKVVIDEAIELAKEYGGETSPAFINGALGHIIEQ
ncbi:MAG TPA: transcription antitermination factor NusB [Patescibacteria group bacterium]